MMWTEKNWNKCPMLPCKVLKFETCWDEISSILESVQKTYFLSLITVHDIANPKWFDSQWVFATYSIIIIQETARNNIKTNKSIISKQLISAQLCKAVRMTVEKQQKSTIGTSKKKKRNLKHTWISYSHHQHLRQHLRHNLCWAGTDVGMMKRSMWYNHRLQNKHYADKAE